MRRIAKPLVTGVVTALAAAALGVAAAAPAQADTVGGGVDGGGAFAEASIVVTVKGGGGQSYGRRVSVPATCWWQPFTLSAGYGAPPVDPDDPESVQAYFDYVAPFLSGHAAGGRLELPTGDYMADIVRRIAAGEELTFYEAKCVPGKNAVSEGLIPKSGTWQGVDFGVRFQAFPPGQVPDPVVPAEVLAQLAREELLFDAPEIEYNPKLANGGGASLVGVPTWFWVDNADEALAPGGRAEATATAGVEGQGPFSTATVFAENTGLTVSSPGLEGGGKTCLYPLYTQAYRPGAADANACTQPFEAASVGQGAGWPVQAETNWTVRWEGVEANGNEVGEDGLTLLNPTVGNADIPVAESQAVVNR
jgi:hypothetical protein